jgi:hypothetical protein
MDPKLFFIFLPDEGSRNPYRNVFLTKMGIYKYGAYF